MNLYFQGFVCIIVGLIVSFYLQKLAQFIEKLSSNHESAVLAIGILSARENFRQRAAARSTWLNNSHAENGNSWFIVGNSSCGIPPDYRLSTYSCEKWNLNISGVQDHFYTNYELYPDTTCSHHSERMSHQGFTFKVNYPVVVTMLGISSQLLLWNNEVKVAIMDIQTKEIIVQALVSSNERPAVKGYIYTEVSEVLLPKNYEGLVLVEGYLKNTACSEMGWNDGGGIITFQRIYPTPHHLESKKHSVESHAATSIGFFIPEIKEFKRFIIGEQLVTHRWLQHLDKVNERLQAEVREKKDVLVVDVIDTYRNLPKKLLAFYQWLKKNSTFSYVLKTDDDTVINISPLLSRLREEVAFDPDRHWIWSRFRKDWPVNYIGKWTDYDYQASYYPAFPCGAVYIIPRSTTSWITSNAEHLHVYQGEDVSMGIWLTAINPDLIEDEKFECSDGCRMESYNRAQLSPREILDSWSNFKKCGHFCSCNGFSIH